MSSSLSVTEFAGPQARALCKAVAKSASTVGVLLTGEPGAGQDSLANDLAQAFLCTNATAGAPCNSCPSCSVFARDMSPDLLDFSPIGTQSLIMKGMLVPHEEFDRKRKDYKYFLPPVSSFLEMPPVQARTKVVVLRQAERMNTDAFNALLKMLEEPPDYVRFILTTSAASQIADTIRSRCVLIPCDLPLDADSSFIGMACGGAPEIREKLLADSMSPFLDAFREFCENLEKRRAGEAVRVSEEFQDLIPLYKDGIAGEIEDRFARADVVRLFANITARQGATSRLEKLIDIHRAVQGNANFGYLCDALFMSELS